MQKVLSLIIIVISFAIIIIFTSFPFPCCLNIVNIKVTKCKSCDSNYIIFYGALLLQGETDLICNMAEDILRKITKNEEGVEFSVKASV